MKKSIKNTVIFGLLSAAALFAQSEGAFEREGSASASAPAGLLDPSRITVNHSMSFAAGGSRMSDIKSQSVYSTMFQYKFDAPVVLRLNFDMPLHSTFNSAQNFTGDNLASMDYFRNMPVDASISWQPSRNFMLSLAVIKQPESYSYFSNRSFFMNSFRSDRYRTSFQNH
ncbi:MAG: hypothetical protein LBI42_00020 [Chitinispirillales bacterium]|jgi:hypothetical protein|nr:hypothetical protein [Chitinispirillales bacterium]